MEILSLFTAFLLTLFIQGLFINGISIAANGKTEILPDGNEKDSEMLLYPIKKWIDRFDEVKVYYTGDRLSSLMKQIKSVYFNNDIHPDSITFSTAIYNLESAHKKQFIIENKSKFERELNVSIEEVPSGFLFYILEKKYKHSKWLRNPFFGCIKCMPSVWGSVSFWIILLVFFDLSQFSIWQILSAWIIDITCLIPISFYISNKINR